MQVWTQLHATSVPVSARARQVCRGGAPYSLCGRSYIIPGSERTFAVAEKETAALKVEKETTDDAAV
jgi:hypothetical protein